jgi:TRAP-type C4-dicarboxylate transport system permease small subunit
MLINTVFTRLAQIDVRTGKDPDQINIPTTDLSSASVATILEVVFGILGSVAFLVIVIAGLRFVLSRGNAEAAGKARNTIIYAAVGLVIAMLAFSIVRIIVREVA